MERALDKLEMESEEDNSSGTSSSTSTLHFHPAIWDLYRSDVGNIILAIQTISLQIQTQEGSNDHHQIKANNGNFVTPKIWEALHTSGGRTTQLHMEYLMDLCDKLEAVKGKIDEYSDEKEKNPPLTTKFSNPAIFPQCA